MRRSHSLLLVIPGVCLPGQVLNDLSFDLPVPALRRLLAVGRHRSTRQHAADRVHPFLDAFLSPQTITPTAPLRLLGLGGEPGDHHWLCLDPIHLGLRERSIVAQPAEALGLSHSEASQLASAVAPAFARFGELRADSPGAWHVRLHQAAPDFPSLSSAIQPGTTPGLCPDKTWQVAITEAQMILHQHPVNHAREARGQPTVNSLWPWGGGRLDDTAPLTGSAPKQAFIAHTANPLLIGLARRHGYGHAAPPASFAELDLTEATLSVIELAALDTAAHTGQAQPWREGLGALEESWFAPLASALNASAAERWDIQLVFPGKHQTHWLSVGPRAFSPWQTTLRALKTRLRIGPVPCRLATLADSAAT